MHPFFNNVPAFLVKLWKLVSDPSTDDLIAWNHNGSSFIIPDAEKFAKELLPQYFKHSNMQSFIRQLNMYGFRKVMNFGKATYSEECEFQHAFFYKEKVDLLANIKRKIAATKVVEAEPVNFDSKDILTNLSSLREKQKVMDTTLTKMKKENELLWRELSTVRQRHKAQEQLLHKVIQFLVQIIQRSNQNIHVPRKLARMLQNSSASQENSSQVARIVDALRSKDSDCIIEPEETASNSVGAVIHEVTDDSDVATSYKIPAVTKFNTSILKPLASGNKSSAVPFISSNETVSSSLEPLNVLEHIHKRTTSLDNQTSKDKSAGFPVKFVAVPVQGDPNKLILIPVENFTTQEISNFKEDSFCNVIALPGKESDSDAIPISVSKPPGMDDTSKNTSPKNKRSSLDVNTLVDVPEVSFPHSLQFTSAPSQGVCETSPEMDCDSSHDFDDSVLSDLLQASRISSITESRGKKDSVHKSRKHSLEEDVLDLKYLESSNNQLAIPDSSSLLKSTKNFSDLSVLQEPSKSSNVDVKYLEQLFTSDDALNAENFVSKISGDVNMGTPLDDIIGNELVQFTPTVQGDSGDIDLSPWFDFLNQDCDPNSLLDNNFYCDPDMQIETIDNPFLSSLESVKNETILTAPKKNHFQNVKKTKRRKMK